MNNKEEEEEGGEEDEEEKENDVVVYDSTPGESFVEGGCVINCVKPKSDGAYRVYYASMTDKQNSHPLFVGFKHRNFNSMEEMIADNCLTDDYIQLIKETPINGFARHIGCVGENARKDHCLMFHQYNDHKAQYHTIKPFGTELPQELLSSVHGCGVVALLLCMEKEMREELLSSDFGAMLDNAACAYQKIYGGDLLAILGTSLARLVTCFNDKEFVKYRQEYHNIGTIQNHTITIQED